MLAPVTSTSGAEFPDRSESRNPFTGAVVFEPTVPGKYVLLFASILRTSVVVAPAFPREMVSEPSGTAGVAIVKLFVAVESIPI